jgi:hypothetical protein
VTELALKSPLRQILTSLSLVAGKAAHVVIAKAVSDHWKQKAILAYAKQIFILTVKLALLLLGLAGALIMLVAISDFFVPATKDFLFGLNGIILSLVTTVAYLKLRSLLVHI